MNREQTKAFLDAFLKMRANLTDQQASGVADMYPALKGNGALVKVGTRINWNGTIYKAAVDLYDTESNNPTNAPALWEELNYKEGHRIIPAALTVGTAFALGEYGWWNGVLYKSLIANNVWTPDAYAAGWELVNE